MPSTKYQSLHFPISRPVHTEHTPAHWSTPYNSLHLDNPDSSPTQPLPDSIYILYLFSFQKGILNLCITLSSPPPLQNKQSSKHLRTLVFLWTWRWSLDHSDTLTEGLRTPWVIQAKQMLSTGKKMLHSHTWKWFHYYFPQGDKTCNILKNLTQRPET